MRLKTFFMLISAEHGISVAHRRLKILKNNYFPCSKHSDDVFILLINVKMPTIVGILSYMSRKRFMLS